MKELIQKKCRRRHRGLWGLLGQTLCLLSLNLFLSAELLLFMPQSPSALEPNSTASEVSEGFGESMDPLWTSTRQANKPIPHFFALLNRSTGQSLNFCGYESDQKTTGPPEDDLVILLDPRMDRVSSAISQGEGGMV